MHKLQSNLWDLNQLLFTRLFLHCTWVPVFLSTVWTAQRRFASNDFCLIDMTSFKDLLHGFECYLVDVGKPLDDPLLCAELLFVHYVFKVLVNLLVHGLRVFDAVKESSLNLLQSRDLLLFCVA